jgi:hypothetical protein
MIFPNFLLRFLFGSSMLCFAAGAVAIGDGGGGDASAVVDAGAEDATAGDTGESGESAESVEGATGEESVEGSEVETQQTEGKADEKIDWRTVPQAVRSHLQELKKTDPKLANLVQNAVYTSQQFLRTFPGGLKEVQGLKQAVDEVGGVEEIRTLRDTHRAVVEEQEDLDRRAASGDVSVLDNLIDVAGESGFGKLMPAALDRWMQKAPAEYSHAMAQVMVAAMQEGGVVANLNMAIQLFGLGTPEAIKLGNEALGKATGYLNSVNEIAAKAPEKPKVDPQIAQQQQQIETERTKIFNDRFADRFSSWRNPEIARNLSELAPKGKQFSDYQRSVFVSGVIEELKRVLTSDDDYTRSLERVYNTKNLEDLFKFTKSRAEKLIPEASKKVYRQLFTESTLGGKKPVTQVQKPGQQAAKPGVAAGAQAANKAWAKIAQGPKPDDIDRTKTDFKMIALGKSAILKDGRKVYWGDRAPA